MSDGAEKYYSLMVTRPDSDGNTDALLDAFHPITAGEFEVYEETANRLTQAVRGSLKTYAERALRDLESVVTQIQGFNELPNVGLRGIIEVSPDLQVAFTCSVLTFCVALHLYQEQSYTQAARLYGEPSTELDQIRCEFSRGYDQQLAYRLVYRLRNVLIHYSPECVDLVFSAREERSSGGIILHQHTVKALLRRDKFLATPRGISAKLRGELRAQREDPDLLNLCRDALQELNSIHNSIFPLMHPELSNDIDLIRQLDALFGRREGDRSIVVISNVSSGNPSMRYVPLRQELFDYVRNT